MHNSTARRSPSLFSGLRGCSQTGNFKFITQAETDSSLTSNFHRHQGSFRAQATSSLCKTSPSGMQPPKSPTLPKQLTKTGQQGMVILQGTQEQPPNIRGPCANLHFGTPLSLDSQPQQSTAVTTQWPSPMQRQLPGRDQGPGRGSMFCKLRLLWGQCRNSRRAHEK